MPGLGQPVKMVPVVAKNFESVGYVVPTRQLFIKLRGGATLCFEKVPGFRHAGLMAAPRKDGYYDSFIKHSFLMKTVEPSMPG